MNAFFAQLAAINPNYVAMITSALTSKARRDVEGWIPADWAGDFSVGKVAFPILPTATDAKVRLSSSANYCDVTTDAKSAGAALALLVVNHLLWAVAESGDQANGRKLEKLFYAMRNAAIAPRAKLDASAILSYID